MRYQCCNPKIKGCSISFCTGRVNPLHCYKVVGDELSIGKCPKLVRPKEAAHLWPLCLLSMDADLLVYQWGFLLVMISFDLINRHHCCHLWSSIGPMGHNKVSCMFGDTWDIYRGTGATSKGAWGLGSDFYVSLVHHCPPWGV